MLKFQNSKRRLARHRGVVKWGALALLAVTAVAMCAGYIEAGYHLPSFTNLAEIGGSGTLFALPALMGLVSYQGKDEFERTVLSSVRTYGDEIDKLRQELLRFRQAGIARRGATGVSPTGQVSEDCARHVAAIVLAIGLKTGKLIEHSGDLAESHVREILGAEWRTALTASDIPLPTEYSGEVVELVSRYGTARRYGTVFPLGAGQLKLPALKTDPAFGLVGASAPIPEKSPQTEWVTFNAEKFGGLVRMPSEISEDSIVAMGQFLARYAARNMALCEDSTFWKGDGSDTPDTYNGEVEGLIFSTITNSKVLQLATTKTHYSDAALANFRSLRGVPDEAVFDMAAYYMHPTFEQLLSTFNSAGDRPYNPNAQLAGATMAQPFITGPTLDGFPIHWINTLPAFSTSVNANKVFVLFGDPSYQYLAIRGGMRFATSTEAGFTTDEVLVRALERYQIGLMAKGAVAGLETGPTS
jgi:HK97 family phage major capsid protein